MPWATTLSRLSRKQSGAGPWIIAVALFGAGLATRFALGPWLDVKFLTFYPPIALASLICGWRQGMLVVALSGISAWYFFANPLNSFELTDPKSVTTLIGFLLVGGFIVVIEAAMRDLIIRLEQAKADLEDAKLLQEDLFRELQHRVANNLQVVVAMLHSAERRLRDNPQAAQQAIKDAEARIWAMSKLNRRLYDGAAALEGLAPILKETLREVFGDLPVAIKLDVTDAPLSINQMTSIILLVTEAATNAAKHVFSKGRGTLFEVVLAKQENGGLRLLIRDDGPGMEHAGIAALRSQSLGMSIMQAFAHQLGGSLKVRSAAGMTLTLDFSAT